MNQDELIAYTLNWLRPHCMPGKSKVRIGSKNDGGYVLLNDLSRIRAVLSFGVGDNVDADLVFADRGAKVYQYDHTVDKPPIAHPGFKHVKSMIGGTSGLSIYDILIQNDLLGSNELLLKCDIEGSEWNLLGRAQSDDLAHFEQMVIEFHDFNFLQHEDHLDFAFMTLEKINRTHAPIHVHGNNNDSPRKINGIWICPVLEVTYVRRDLGPLIPSGEQFPTELDAPNNPGWDDIPLGRFTYV